MANLEPTGQYIGIDVSKQYLDIYIPTSQKYLRVKNSIEGLGNLCEQLENTPQHFVAEGTGGLEHNSLEFLTSSGHRVSVVNPRHVRRTGQGLGLLAKTDKIDAKLLSLFGDIANPRVTLPRTQNESLLCELVSRRRQLVRFQTQEKNHLKSCKASVNEDVEDLLDILKNKIKLIEKRIQDLIHLDQIMKRKAEILQSVPGIAGATTTQILAELPELGSVTSKEIAAIVGVAPYNCDSGKMKGKRVIYGGRSSMRSTLFMSTLVATRHNQKIKDFYEKLQANGKPKRVALIASMRKILCIINHLIKHDQLWRDDIE